MDIDWVKGKLSTATLTYSPVILSEAKDLGAAKKITVRTSVPVKVYYPPADERVSHFRPVYDFVRISILNTVLCVLALVYGYPRMAARAVRRIFA